MRRIVFHGVVLAGLILTLHSLECGAISMNKYQGKSTSHTATVAQVGLQIQNATLLDFPKQQKDAHLKYACCLKSKLPQKQPLQKAAISHSMLIVAAAYFSNINYTTSFDPSRANKNRIYRYRMKRI